MKKQKLKYNKFEQYDNKVERMNDCLKSGSHHEDFGLHAYKVHACGLCWCKECIEYREKQYSQLFSWIRNGYTILEVKENVIQTGEDVISSYQELHEFKCTFEKEHEDLEFYRVGMGHSRMYLIVNAYDRTKFDEYKPVWFGDFIRDYVDWSRMSDDAKKHMMFYYSKHKRILWKGNHREGKKTSYVHSVHEKDIKGESKMIVGSRQWLDQQNRLKMKNSKKGLSYAMKKKPVGIISTQLAKANKIPETHETPIEECAYQIVLPGTDIEPTILTFKELLLMELQAQNILESKYDEQDKLEINVQWEEYLPKFSTKSIQNTLKQLYDTEPEYEFLSCLFKDK